MPNKLPKLCLVAVDIRSAHNVGALFRSCSGFDAELFLIGVSPYPALKNDSRLPHIARRAEREISKTALGAEKYVTWRYAPSLNECVKLLKSEDYKIFAIEQSKESLSIRSFVPADNTALVVGREVEGLSPEELELCDGLYEIPMLGQKESFNVAVAGGIALYQARLKYL